MENLQLFNFKEKKIRVSEVNGEAWFCLKDVCAILEITNQNNVASRLNQKGIHSVDTPTNGGIQQMNFINESNLYNEKLYDLPYMETLSELFAEAFLERTYILDRWLFCL